MDKKQVALEYLNKNQLLHADMIDCINNNQAKIVYANNDGVVIYNLEGRVYCISLEKDADIESILALCKRNRCSVIHQDFYYPLIKEKFKFKHKKECYQVVYTKPFPPQNQYDFEIKPLTLDYVNFVFDNYSNRSSIRYITDRIKSNSMFGAFSGNDIMGFIGVHDEGSMGMLEVMPEYRKKGVGYALEAFLISERLKNGHIPYAHIFTSNIASCNLQKKLGMEFADQIISWVF
ncbi:MAG TPA: GNAT family N-acetyltransferase [Clostridia bacterium]